jgi:hypothetical protein
MKLNSKKKIYVIKVGFMYHSKTIKLNNNISSPSESKSRDRFTTSELFHL